MSDMGSQSSHKGDVKVTEHSAKPSFGQRVKSFLKRFWWLVLGIFIAIVLLVVLLLIFVGFPKIAQTQVNESTLDITSMKLTDPTPDSFHLQQESVMHSTSSFSPQLDAFNVSLYVAGGANPAPFAYVEIPALKASHQSTISVDQVIKFADANQFSEYAKVVMTSEEYKLGIKGRTGLKQGSLPKTTVDYDKVVTLKGLNNLKGFNVTSFEIKLTPLPDGSNLIGTVFIPNPSILTVAMGNVTMNLSVDGAFIGTSAIDNLILVPGDNNVKMRSTVNQTLVLQKYVTNAKNGILTLDVVGNSSVYNGQHLTYFENALKASTQQVQLNLASALGGLA